MSLRHGLRWFSARRRRTVSRDRLSCGVSLTSACASSSSVQRARPAGGLEQVGRHQQGFFLAGELALCPGTGLFAQCPLQVALNEAPLGPVHRGPANPNTHGDILIADPRVRGQQDLCSLELPRRLLAPAQRRLKLGTFVLGQIDTIAYIHLSLLVGDPVESTDESNV